MRPADFHEQNVHMLHGTVRIIAQSRRPIAACDDMDSAARCYTVHRCGFWLRAGHVSAGKFAPTIYATAASHTTTMANMFENRPSNEIATWIRQTYSADMIEIDEFRQKEVTLKLPHDLEDINLLFEDVESEFPEYHIAFKFFMSCGQPRVALDISAKDCRTRNVQNSSHIATILAIFAAGIAAVCATLIYTKYAHDHIESRPI